METQVLKVDPLAPDPGLIRLAADAIRRGELVAFPTETVYGLGANALDPEAVERIFTAKGRPARNPVIVHVATEEDARHLVTTWPDSAGILAERFWPGPLTLVLPKSANVPDIVTAVGPTVGIRVPATPVALALLREAAVPIAAPSANRSTELSPTTAKHVLKGLRGRIEYVLDGGPTTGGIESTVLDLSGDKPRLLRPGLVTAEQIEKLIGPTDRPVIAESRESPLPSPGLMRRHYAPKARVILVDDVPIEEHKQAGLLPIGHKEDVDRFQHIETMPDNPDAYASKLYATLHSMDDAGVDVIMIELPPDTPAWSAIRDRLKRAASED